MKGCDYFCSGVSESNLNEHVLSWLTEQIPRKEDASHIKRKFVPTELTTNNFCELYEAVTCYYESKTLYKARVKDIKEFETLKELIDYENLIWPKITKNLPLVKKPIEPLEQNLEPKFVVFKVNEFEESVSLTNGHPIFDGNIYNYCFGTFKYDYELYVTFRERNKFLKVNSLIDKSFRCNTMYYIRDLSRTTAYAGKIPNCVFEDPKHITIIWAGLQPAILNNAYRMYAKHHKNMSELFKENPEFEVLKPLLVFNKPN